MEKTVLVLENTARSFKGTKGMHIGGGIAVRTGSENAIYDIYFTDKRIIAAVVYSTSDTSKLMPVSSVQMMRWKKRRAEKRATYQGKSPSEILEMHKDSFEVPYANVQSIKMKKGMFGAKLEVEAVWEGNVSKFEVPIPKERLDEAKRTIEVYMPGKVS